MDPLTEIREAIEKIQNADVERILMDYVKDKNEIKRNEDFGIKNNEINLKKTEFSFKAKIKPFKIKNTEYSYLIEKEKNKNKPKLIYYYSPKIIKPQEAYYVFVPSGITMRRVPQSHLGFGVLGRAFPGLNTIEILETLYGTDFEEVKFHEVKHVQYPHLSEIEIRQRVKSELPFEARYH